MKAQLYDKLAARLLELGFARVHSDAREPVARAALAAFAGLPSYEQLWTGDLRGQVQVVAVASGERLPGVELARRADLLAERARNLGPRVGGLVQVLQLVLYDRPVPREERAFILSKARVTPFWPASGRVATWVLALDEPAVYASKLRGWPSELSADAVRELLKA